MAKPVEYGCGHTVVVNEEWHNWKKYAADREKCPVCKGMVSEKDANELAKYDWFYKTDDNIECGKLLDSEE